MLTCGSLKKIPWIDLYREIVLIISFSIHTGHLIN